MNARSAHKEIPDEAIERHLEFAAAMPTWKSLMHMHPVDGVAGLVASDATAWAYRTPCGRR